MIHWLNNKKATTLLIFILLIGVMFIIALTILDPILSRQMECTLVGCFGGITVELSGLPPSSRYQIAIISPPGEARTLYCGPNSAKTSQAPFWHGCTPEGAFFLLDADSNPQEITVAVTVEGKRISKVFHPEYEISQPNGENCPPTCYSATIEMNITQ